MALVLGVIYGGIGVLLLMFTLCAVIPKMEVHQLEKRGADLAPAFSCSDQ